MRLYELAYCCRLYGQITGYDASIDRLRQATSGNVDLLRRDHAEAVVVWLRSWGCRQFAIAYTDQSTQALIDWWEQWGEELPELSRSLATLRPMELDIVARS